MEPAHSTFTRSRPEAGDVRLQGGPCRGPPSDMGGNLRSCRQGRQEPPVPSEQAYSVVRDARTAPAAPSVAVGEWWGGVGGAPPTM